MNEVKSVYESNGKKFYLTWMPNCETSNLTPVTQVYGIVFNDKGEILIVRANENDKWQIPGGTPEGSETWEQTLNRELIEEADVTVKNAKFLGAQKVEQDVDGVPTLSSYQLRYFGILDKLLDQTIDPDVTKSFIWQRKFVPASEITEYVKWGDLGKSMFDDAVKMYNEIQK